jgi:hypothetical protein
VFAPTRTNNDGFYRVSLPEGQYVVANCHIHTPNSDANGTPHHLMINKTTHPMGVQIGMSALGDEGGFLC